MSYSISPHPTFLIRLLRIEEHRVGNEAGTESLDNGDPRSARHERLPAPKYLCSRVRQRVLDDPVLAALGDSGRSQVGSQFHHWEYH